MSIEKARPGASDPAELTSAAAKAGDPPYFHRQPSTVTFDFDQGLPDAQTYPADLDRRDGGRHDPDGIMIVHGPARLAKRSSK